MHSLNLSLQIMISARIKFPFLAYVPDAILRTANFTLA